ncbi:outer membrane protein assembly factor BamB family protein [Actibacterium lipolyticum]|uniref:Pyrrolo-quinoline quinone repeat domain-containing protein n=1 Tax=Actibacterium lipolyticum TaxID=1524263 RepID=A0A238JXZ3_9RHOB|nr:PQQ-binding-like beta-propeller repeat protein [Actibacterium lipolyticum]SMX34994.1 hypothetical protein COL8621_01595 [Actibacterium lipolyticum]
MVKFGSICVAFLCALNFPTVLSAATLAQPGFTEVEVVNVNDRRGNFGNITFDDAGNAYVVGANRRDNGQVYRIEDDGSLTLIGDATSGNQTATGITFKDGSLFVTSSHGRLYEMDAVTGQTTVLTKLKTKDPTDVQIIDGLYGAEFTILVVAEDGGATWVDGTTGEVQLTTSGLPSMNAIEVGADGTLFALSDESPSGLFSFDENGLIETVVEAPGGVSFENLAIHQGTGEIFASTSAGEIYVFDPLTLNATLFASDLAQGGALSFSADGTQLYFGEQEGRGGYTISYFDGFDQYELSAVPLPATLPLLGAAVGIMAYARRRKKTKS